MGDDNQAGLLQDILYSAQAIRSYLEGVTREAFFSDGEKQDAVLRRFEIIGEAASRLLPETRGGRVDEQIAEGLFLVPGAKVTACARMPEPFDRQEPRRIGKIMPAVAYGISFCQIHPSARWRRSTVVSRMLS